MKKQWIWILSISMGIIVIGLFIVQVYWIKQAFKVKESQFIKVIKSSLMNVSSDVQQREAYRFIADEYDSLRRNPLYKTYNNQKQYETNRRQPEDVPIPQSITPTFRANVKGNISYTSNDSVLFSSEFQHDIISNENVTYESYRFSSVPTTIQEKRINQKRRIEQILEKMSRTPRELQNRLTFDELNYSLQDRFDESGINLDYEFALLDNKNKIVYKSEGFNPSTASVRYRTALFPDDYVSDPGELIVYFPTEKKYVFSSLGIMSYSSLGLGLLTILLFILTIAIIYKQKQLSEIKNDFIGNMTHELKTPISTISLASQMLSDNTIPMEAKNLSHISNVIRDESRRLGYQVEKVLQMAIFDKGRLKLKRKKYNLEDIISSVLNNFSLQIGNRNGKIDLEFNAENPEVKVDIVHFTNVISNLLDNAIKYSDGPPVIKIRTWNKNKRTFIAIKDNGVGISSENQRRIWEKFYRVPTGNLHNVKGFGLGLSYAKKVTEAHEGTVTCNSEEGKGTEFIIGIDSFIAEKEK